MPIQRLIDQDERTQKRPMRVLVLGMCRLRTTSISSALRKLGYTPHQMRDILIKPSELSLWQEAINVTFLPPQDRPTKQRNQPPYTLTDFDKLPSEYDAVIDLPGCIFAKELIQAYPKAKVILMKETTKLGNKACKTVPSVSIPRNYSHYVVNSTSRI
ncbi:hypothetical protein T440DRAFT_469115 [Plenodomus tracheiphilus IPT5]|uniref:Uncharacterized protein n=1 Tax=Plenodomus tracheiphilus IPT5 TaxID=1408161 RepID=A0A6A7B350_9PLEO|nr:hypothetical protein T440DRAFT_469115 [Plenodomus tracheiphilus IPT5]